MKTILYIIALVAIAGSGVFTYTNISKHELELAKTDALEKDNAVLRGEIKNLDGKIFAQTEEKNGEQSKKDELSGEIDLTKGKIVNLNKQSDGLNGRLDGLKEEKSEIDSLIAKVEEEVGSAGTTIAEIPEYFEDIQEQKKQLTQSHNSLLAELDRVSTDVASKKSEVAALNSAQETRRKNLTANGVSSLITSVDNDWGFVIVKPHTDALIKQDSQLIVVRGDKHVGRLSINAIEEGRVLANINYGSLVSGMRIRPGDRVILGKVLTR